MRLVTCTVVSPMLPFTARVVVAATPPEPVTAVTCVPLTTCVPTGVPVKGEPIGGAVPVKPIMSAPNGVINCVVIVPLEPAENTLNDGLPTALPV